MVEVVNSEKLELLKERHPRLVIDFFAQWCGPCKIVSAHLDDTAQKAGNDCKIVKVDIEASPELAQRYDVRSIPTIVFLHGNQEVSRHIGVMTQTQMLNKIQSM